jgi:hypothetical protein
MLPVVLGMFCTSSSPTLEDEAAFLTVLSPHALPALFSFSSSLLDVSHGRRFRRSSRLRRQVGFFDDLHRDDDAHPPIGTSSLPLLPSFSSFSPFSPFPPYHLYSPASSSLKTTCSSTISPMPSVPTSLNRVSSSARPGSRSSSSRAMFSLSCCRREEEGCRLARRIWPRWDRRCVDALFLRHFFRN